MQPLLISVKQIKYSKLNSPQFLRQKHIKFTVTAQLLLKLGSRKKLKEKIQAPTTEEKKENQETDNTNKTITGKHTFYNSYRND